MSVTEERQWAWTPDWCGGRKWNRSHKCCLWVLSSFLTHTRATSSGVAPPKLGSAPPSRLCMNNYSRLINNSEMTGQSYSAILSIESLYFQMTVACVQLTNIKKTKQKEPQIIQAIKITKTCGTISYLFVKKNRIALQKHRATPPCHPKHTVEQGGWW